MSRTLFTALCLLLLLACEDDVPWQRPDGSAAGGLGALCFGDDDCDSGLICAATQGVCSRAAVPEDSIVAPTTDVAEIDVAVEDVASAPCADFEDQRFFDVNAGVGKTKLDAETQAQRIWYKADDTGYAFGDVAWLRVTAYEGLTGSPQESGARIDISELPLSADVGFQVRLGLGCDDEGKECQRDFLATEGRGLVSGIDWATPEGSTFAGSLRDLRFEEVTFRSDETPLLVYQGCTFGVEEFDWSILLTLARGK